jgi:hypothetical protein
MFAEIAVLFLGYLLVAILGIAVKVILKPYTAKIEISGIKGAGSLIGIFERILVFTFVLTNQYAAISIIFAAKSIARFGELNERDFAEYYLLGTFTSITIALIVGIIFKLIFGSFSF